jgi:hypothetical protein
MTAHELPATAGERAPRAGRLVLLTFASGVAWVVALLGSYVVAARGCDPKMTEITALDPRRIAMITLAVLGVMVVATVWSGVAAWRRWRDVSADEHLLRTDAAGRTPFLAVTGLLFSIIFLFGILLFLASDITLAPCSRSV